MKRILLSLAALFCPALLSAQIVKVGALHPILGDLARQVGGDRVEVVDLLPPGGDIHHFEPTSKDIARMKGMQMIFASGKHLESYLDKLRDSLGAGVPIVEVGKTIPSLKVEVGEMFLCCPNHAQGGIDPHWWHSADNMQRAARVVADSLTSLDPSGKDIYKAGASAASDRFEGLKRWAKQQISAIPRGDRKLVTAHAAYAYFCKEYGLKSVPLLGLGAEDEATAQHIANVVKAIQENKIKAVFPEDKANPKVLAQIAGQTGIKIGQPLVADGTAVHAHTFETMLRHNVAVIVAALAQP